MTFPVIEDIGQYPRHENPHKQHHNGYQSSSVQIADTGKAEQTTRRRNVNELTLPSFFKIVLLNKLGNLCLIHDARD